MFLCFANGSSLREQYDKDSYYYLVVTMDSIVRESAFCLCLTVGLMVDLSTFVRQVSVLAFCFGLDVVRY